MNGEKDEEDEEGHDEMQRADAADDDGRVAIGYAYVFDGGAGWLVFSGRQTLENKQTSRYTATHSLLLLFECEPKPSLSPSLLLPLPLTQLLGAKRER